MALLDSVDKIVTRYFSVVTDEVFTYKGVVYHPKDIKVSPLLFRDYTCPSGCGACCPRFSLDYLPTDNYPYALEKRFIQFNGRPIPIYSDTQTDHKNYHCRNLNMSDGRCGIHGKQPFSCDFELIRMLTFEGDSQNTITQKLFGRGWAMKRIDGGRGTRCTMTPITPYSIDEVVRKLKRLEGWCDHFHLKNKLPQILQWVTEIRPFVLYKEIKPAIFTTQHDTLL